jgi:WD40 repeat protein
MATPTGDQFCPYKGLQPYTEGDRKYFFGRTRDIGIIISNLYAASITVFYGASGVGKSSVLLAGVVPQLREEPHNAVVVVFNKWQVDDFVGELKDAIAKQSGQTSIDRSLPLNKFLEETQRAVDLPFFLICDQFEEYFLYHPPSPAADAFESAFARAINSRSCQVNFMLSMREDALSKLDRFQGRVPTMLNNMLRLNHLDAESAREAITKPIEQYNVEGREHAPISIEPGLVEAVLQDLTTVKVASSQLGQGEVSAQAGVDDAPIETPFLQMVLTRLWDEETSRDSHTLGCETFEKLGRASQIALTHLDTTMTRLSEAERSTAGDILRYLVTPSGSKIAQEVGALAAWSELPETEIQNILNRLSAPDVRILKIVQTPRQPPRYEIFHDVLARAILDWRARYVQQQKLLESQRQLEAERAAAAERLQKQTARTKRLRYVIAGLLLIGVVIIYLGIKALQARFLAHARELAAYSKSQVNIDPEVSLLLAIEAVKQKQTSRSISALKEALQNSRVTAVLDDGHNHAVRGISFSPDGLYVATASWDTTAAVWERATGKLVSKLSGMNKEVNGVSFSNDGRYLVTASLDGYARIWEDWRTPSPRVVATMADGKEIWTANFSPDGNYLVTGGVSGKVIVWDWRNHAKKAELTFGPAPTSARAPVSAAAESLPTASPDPMVAIPSSSPQPSTSRIIIVFKAMFGPDGERVVAVGKWTGVMLWKWKEEVGPANPIKLGSHADAVYDVAFSPDGKYVVTGSKDTTAVVWSLEAQENRRRATLNLLPNIVRGVGFTPDGKFVVTGGDDGVARMWDWQSARKGEDKSDSTTELHGHKDIVFCVAVSRDGQFIGTGSEDHAARIWRTESLSQTNLDKMSTNELLKLASSRVTRQLTREERERYLD